MKKNLAMTAFAVLAVVGGYFFYQKESVSRQQCKVDYSSIKNQEQEEKIENILEKIKQESSSEANYRERLFEFIENAPSSSKKVIAKTMRKKSTLMPIHKKWLLDELLSLKTNVPLMVACDKDGKPVHPKKQPPTKAQYKAKVKQLIMQSPNMDHVFTILGHYDFWKILRSKNYTKLWVNNIALYSHLIWDTTFTLLKFLKNQARVTFSRLLLQKE